MLSQLRDDTAHKKLLQLGCWSSHASSTCDAACDSSSHTTAALESMEDAHVSE